MGASQPMFGLIQRCSRRSHKAAIILEATSPCPFGDVGFNTVCGPNDLFPNRVPSEAIPTADRQQFTIQNSR